MLKDITLGQYFPGDSVVHRLDPRVKLVWVVFYIAALFQATGLASYGVMVLVTAGCVGLSHVPPKALVKGLKPILIIIVLTAVLNLFYTVGTPVVQIWKLTITYEGIARAFFMDIRIVMLICGTFLLT